MELKAQLKGKALRKLSGFTLVELIMVMVLLGVLVAAALPKLIPDQSLNLKMRSMLVRSDIRYAVDYATNTGTIVRVVFDVAGNKYSFWIQDGAGGWQYLQKPVVGGNYDVTLGSADYEDLILTNVNIGGMDELYINSLGVPLDKNLQPLSGSAAQITLNNSRVIEISPLTGKVQLIS